MSDLNILKLFLQIFHLIRSISLLNFPITHLIPTFELVSAQSLWRCLWYLHWSIKKAQWWWNIAGQSQCRGGRRSPIKQNIADVFKSCLPSFNARQSFKLLKCAVLCRHRANILFHLNFFRFNFLFSVLENKPINNERSSPLPVDPESGFFSFDWIYSTIWVLLRCLHW